MKFSYSVLHFGLGRSVKVPIVARNWVRNKSRDCKRRE